MYFIVDLAAILKKTYFRFRLLFTKLLGDGQTISNGAANTSFLLIPY
jgi:hypothetical protein